jgi:hypothetical protein
MAENGKEVNFVNIRVMCHVRSGILENDPGKRSRL